MDTLEAAHGLTPAKENKKQDLEDEIYKRLSPLITVRLK
jgi:hypothetical protein